MSYKITQEYCWYDNARVIIRIYMINGIPFSFDELTEKEINDSKILNAANKNRDYSQEDLFLYSFYLIEEEFHPLIYDLDLENPEDLPKDDYLEEDLYY